MIIQPKWITEGAALLDAWAREGYPIAGPSRMSVAKWARDSQRQLTKLNNDAFLRMVKPHMPAVERLTKDGTIWLR